MRAFLYRDYFHDSIIDTVTLQANNSLKLRLWCEREWSDDCFGTDDCRIYFGVRRVNIPALAPEDGDAARRPEHPAYRNYLYTMTFRKCAICELNVDVNRWWLYEYINGVFKDSFRLHEVVRSRKRPHFHFRIQTSRGFIDIIFRKFDIRREVGSFRVRTSRKAYQQFSIARRHYTGQSRAAVLRAMCDKSEITRSFALQYLYLCRDKDLLKYASREVRQCVSRRTFDPNVLNVVTAVYILGKRGHREHLPMLFELSCRYTDPLFRRHIQDAVERILSRRK